MPSVCSRYPRFSIAAIFMQISACAYANPVSANSVSSDLAFSPKLITVNQVGYLTNAQKVATVVENSETPVNFEVYDLNKKEYVLRGKTKAFGHDAASGKNLHHVDFSALKKPGRYSVKVEGTPSYSFDIREDIYNGLAKDALHYFYFHRMGIELQSQFLANPAHARRALHPGDDSVSCFENWCGKNVKLNARYSWADAGDYGIYAVNHAISAWTLLNAYEFNEKEHRDSDLNIPENKNGIPDILDEVRFGSTFIPGLLPPSGALASHKVHNQNWTAYPLNIEEENSAARFAQPPSSAATYAVSRVSAHLARAFKAYDKAYANKHWRHAQDAWNRAQRHPVKYYTPETRDSVGGGDYADQYIEDDKYAALVELFITARVMADNKLAKQYRDELLANKTYLILNSSGSQSWHDTHGAGTLSLYLHWKHLGLPRADKKILENNIINAAKKHLKVQKHSGYPTAYNPYAFAPKTPWLWGSNGELTNNMIVLAYAYKITGEKKYFQGLLSAMDYLLGNNPLNLSFITGYGTNFERDTLDGYAWTKLLEDGAPYPKGWLSGGPMNDKRSCVGEPITNLDAPPALAYGPPGTGSRAWCSKENTINWNAPLYWVAKFLEHNALAKK